MGHNLRFGVCAQRMDPFWLQVEEAIHRRAKSLPVDLVPIRASEGQGSFPDLERVPAAEDLLVLDLDALLGWIWPDEQLYQVLNAGLPVIHLGETSVSHPLLVSPRGLSAAARKVATYLAGRLGGQGRVLMVGGLSPDCPYDRGGRRLAGARQVLAGQPGSRLTHVPSSWDAQSAWQQVRGGIRELEGADGPAEGKAIAEHFEWMKRSHWQQMGWDVETGKPLPETLERLGLSDLVAELDALE